MPLNKIRNMLDRFEAPGINVTSDDVCSGLRDPKMRPEPVTKGELSLYAYADVEKG